MKASLNPTSFLRYLAATITAGLMIAVAFVILVDPYGLYGVIDRTGFNHEKPELTRHISEIKLTHAARMNPDALILGNSRAEIGFDPESSAFLQKGYSAYNLAIPGTGIATSRTQLEYLHDKKIKPRIILLGLEFIDFLEEPGKTPENTARTHDGNSPYRLDKWFWQFDSLVSMASVKEAIHTLAIQSDKEAGVVTSRGFNPLKQYRTLARTEGYYSLFRQRAEENARKYLRKAATGSLDRSDLDQLRAILDNAAGVGTEVKLIIYPYHAQILAMFEDAGLWRYFEEWKQALITEVSAAKKRHPHAHIELLDFSGFDSYRCERIPAKGDRSVNTNWYWEAGHFKKELGDRVLQRVLAPASELRQGVPTENENETIFGMSLDEASWAANRQRIEQERIECASGYPELFAQTKNIMETERARSR